MAFLFAMENIRVHIPKKLYAKSFDEGWLSSMALFVFLAKSHSGKYYIFKKNCKTKFIKELAQKHGFGFTAFTKHLRILTDKGLIRFTEKSMSLISKKELLNKEKYVFVPANISNYKDIKKFLLAIPVLSNLCQQEKTIKRTQHYIYINEELSKSGYKGKNRQYKSLCNYLKNGGKLSFNSELLLARSTFGELIDRKSLNTISKYKKFLKDKGLIKVTNLKEKLYKHKVSFNHYASLKRYGILKNETFFYKGFIFINRPSIYTISYRGVVA